jgi:hypothetical protein
MRNNLRNISFYIISMTANLSSLCAALCSNMEIRKRLTDDSELTFFTSNSNDLLKNKINCVSLFQITQYEEVWWHVSLSKTKENLRDIFFLNFTKRLFYINSFENTVS